MRRLAVLVLGVALYLGAQVALPMPRLGLEDATASSADRAGVDAQPTEGLLPATGTTYDRSVGALDCGLLGRAFLQGAGCARDRCISGAVLWRSFRGAEACSLPGQPEGYGFVATVSHVQLTNRSPVCRVGV